MSHAATNWAIQQRGLKPATKLVLWHLADRYNPDLGCFPSQVQLAYDVEMSRSALNEHLRILEFAGLIRREQRMDGRTRRVQSTRYILGFEADFAQEPSPESGHGNGADPCPESGHGPCPENGDFRVRNPDSNLVREPVRMMNAGAADSGSEEVSDSDLSARLLTALGIERVFPVHVLGLESTAGVIRDWRGRGFAWEALAKAIQPRAFLIANGTVKSWVYFSEIVDRACGGEKPRKKSKAAAPAVPRMTDEERAVQLATWINGDALVLPSMVSSGMRGLLLARGLVTEERLRERQIY